MRLVAFKGGISRIKGSLSIEAAIVIPLFLIFVYLLLLGPLSNVYFNHFEKNLTAQLIDSLNYSITEYDIEKCLDYSGNLKIRKITFEEDELEVIVTFKKVISRVWRIHYPLDKVRIKKLTYITDTGNKYHLFGCEYLRESMIPIFYSIAVLRYDACKVCTLKSHF